MFPVVHKFLIANILLWDIYFLFKTAFCEKSATARICMKDVSYLCLWLITVGFNYQRYLVFCVVLDFLYTFYENKSLMWQRIKPVVFISLLQMVFLFIIWIGCKLIKVVYLFTWISHFRKYVAISKSQLGKYYKG